MDSRHHCYIEGTEQPVLPSYLAFALGFICVCAAISTAVYFG